MDRFSISLSQDELKVVAHAVDASLCVQESLEEAETGDRVKAIDQICGGADHEGCPVSRQRGEVFLVKKFPILKCFGK